MPFEIVRNDIVNMEVDAVVNAANSALRAGGGVCGAIFRAAGVLRLTHACREIGHCDTGEAVITPAFNMNARYIIHAVGPIWQDGEHNEAVLLRSCYLSALELAVENNCASIAFPLISSGIYGYPKQEAFRIAVSAIQDFLLEHELQVYLIVFGKADFLLAGKVFDHIRAYIDDHYADDYARFDRRRTEAAVQRRQLREQQALFEAFTRKKQEDLPNECASCAPAAPLPSAPVPAEPMQPSVMPKRSLADVLSHMDDSFSKMLLRLIDEKGMTDVEVYKRANIDRKLFSKIRKDGYNPSKQTVLALAIALRLNLDETRDLLARAGYALSGSSKFDVIIEYFISERNYDIYAINEALFVFEQKLLGA